MRRKIIALSVIVAMLAIAVIGGTMAYFTDTDDVTNVLTMGNVKIEIHEDNNGQEGESTVETDGEYREWLEEQAFLPGTSYEKNVWVENTGTNPAYVRVFIAYPSDSVGILELAYDNEAGWIDHDDYEVDIAGEKYTVEAFTYRNAVPEKGKDGNVTSVNLSKVSIGADVMCETLADGIYRYYTKDGANCIVENKKGQIPVLVHAMAVQTATFTSANTALDTAFGTVSGYNPWVVEGADYAVTDAAGLYEALTTAKAGEVVTLAADIDMTGVDWTPVDLTNVTLDGNGRTISNLTLTGEANDRNGLIGRAAGITVKNLYLDNITAVGVNATGNTESSAGALVGWLEGHSTASTIENVHVTKANISKAKYVGGIIGYNSGKEVNLTNCSVSDSKIASDYYDEGEYKGHIGGLIGYYSAGGIRGCYLNKVEFNTQSARLGVVVGTAQKDASAVNVTAMNVINVYNNTVPSAVGAVNYSTDGIALTVK